MIRVAKWATSATVQLTQCGVAVRVVFLCHAGTKKAVKQ